MRLELGSAFRFGAAGREREIEETALRLAAGGHQREGKPEGGFQGTDPIGGPILGVGDEKMGGTEGVRLDQKGRHRGRGVPGRDHQVTLGAANLAEEAKEGIGFTAN